MPSFILLPSHPSFPSLAQTLEDNKYADFSNIEPSANTGCNSATAQYIVRSQCIGSDNCTIAVGMNYTYEWQATSHLQCPEGTAQSPTSGHCNSTFGSYGNWTGCDSGGMELLVVGHCR